jgi:hypothetical protein
MTEKKYMNFMENIFPRICEVNDSSNILEVAYDPEFNIMKVTFNNAKYLYRDITPNLFAQIVSADSVGKAFNSLIINKFQGVRVDE